MDTKKNSWLMLSLLFLGLSVNNHLSLGADTISANEYITAHQTIVSANGNFVLGFFKPGNASKYYIGIWNSMSKFPTQQTIVWVANRDNAVFDRSSSVLRISDGNLVLLFNDIQIPVWSTNLNSTTSSHVEAVLLDEGNLVLRDGSTSSKYLWQSFDHPTHTWLPGSKLGFNKITNENQRLISWKNEEDPAPGLFSLELQPNTSSYIILWNRSIQYWTSGAWDGKIFSLVPEMRANYIYNFSYVNNTNESYFTYSLYNPSIISRFVMDVSGQIKQLAWLNTTNQWNLFWSQPKTQCEVSPFCGAFGSCNGKSLPSCSCLRGFVQKSQSDWSLSDFSGGCMRRTALQCENTSLTNRQPDRFFPMPSMALSVQPQSVGVGNAAECESICLNNCSCTAYAYEINHCSIWVGDLLNLQQLTGDDPNGRTLYLKLAASEFPSKKNYKWIIVGAVVGSVAGVAVLRVAVLLGLLVAVILRRRNRAVGTGEIVEGSLVAFGYRDLRNATKNFSDKLGGGGFGSVFKGTLSDSTLIAVKKLESISQGEKQFRAEVRTIGTVNHVNLIRLRGFCSQGTRKLLVYEYMSNGSLESHLFHEKFLDWKTRYQIAIGTARGLAYLHEKCRECIIHCDIKPENILLDAYLCPKVADFGLAKLVGREFSRVLTTMRGTRGYLAPEWISGMPITAKADVYSYGMMLFEFVSGRRNSEAYTDGKTNFFPTGAASLIAEGGDVLSLLDPRLEGNADIEELTSVCKVACWCIQDDDTNRPPMGQVVQMLEGVLDVNLAPIPNSLQVLFADNQEHIDFYTESQSSQSS
ncbi:G-type lectin S-receptor-like serine/threonine-protein kinase At2g19130 [Corylus avellana]|uniref:G-type lectin S-receptor-like serine/threonine-protein kinase At2g19130 n=1 Tax=Corylus avellana TaxID=13451 RepID=UPI001E1FC1ED|nr:G-type lectin S-receptor-like serine/threonine-protein kinase At2g19130 [Corylus avellana]